MADALKVLADALKVLLVEDNEADAELVLRALKKAGHRLVSRRVENATGLEAALGEMDWELVLCDYHLPGFSPEEALSLLHGSGQDPAVILMSGEVGIAEVTGLMRAGAHDFVAKDDHERFLPAVERELHAARDRQLVRESHEEVEKLSRVVEQTPNAVVITDPEGRIEYINSSFTRISGYQSNEVLGENPRLLKSGEMPAAVYKDLWATVLDAEVWQGELCNRSKDGRLYHVQASIFPLLDHHGKLSHLIGIQTDLSERIRAEKALRTSEQRYRSLYDETPAIFLTLNPEGTLLSVNRFAAEELDYAVEDLVGQQAALILPEEEVSNFEQRLADCIQRGGEILGWEHQQVRRNGSVLWVRATARAQIHPQGGATILMVCEDITKAHRLAKQLSYQASHDALTGLVNREAFTSRLERVLKNVRGNDGRHALLYLDLDQFKVINDTCGHIAGDELLRQLSNILKLGVRKRDTLARLGGDEFGVLMEHCSLKQARRVATSLRRGVDDFHFLWDDKSFSLGVSIGLVPIDTSSGDITSLLSAADTACYAAKDAGRNRIHVYHEEDAELARRHGEMQWVSRIHEALEENRLQLWMQTIMPISDSDNSGLHYEILLRMVDKEGGLIPPGAFLPAAERYNLSARIDRWVVKTILSWLSQHPAHLEKLHLCAINLSGHSLSEEDFLTFITRQLDDTQVPPEKLCFEITETAAIANLAAATRFIRVLKEWGCHFALDDFGSGLSSFAYLKNLPVDYLKIDGIFVRDIVEDPIDCAMVKSINEIGQVMGKKTIAEFVENPAILKKLNNIGVNFAQGYGIAKPVPLSTAAFKSPDGKPLLNVVKNRF